jgi:uncharacterized LabA/DUF88 family protein
VRRNAALLIDFDNVTLGVQSDLARELRTLIGSEALGVSVTIQRAYADWRRYPQYLVPLTEASIELVSAPAVGPNKKNATDIRLAIDAMELAFTRPEVDTFVLLSGDSDFSSLVIKLKEWGKYIIGVGMKESSSDTLQRVCHEYYGYSELAGLSRQTGEAPAPTGAPRDPWQLVGEAVQQMVRNRDVMRADRLKQVMQQLDPAFDERKAGSGYSRFSKFVTDAAEKGLITVKKMENGQLEVGPAAEGRAPRAAESRAAEPRAAEGEAREGRGRRRGRGRGRGREEGAEGAAPRAAESAAAPRLSDRLSLAQGFELLKTALAQLETPVAGEALRLRMIALHGKEDALLEVARFERFLRQAHDAELAEVRKVDDGQFDVLPFGQTAGAPARYERPAQPASRPIAEAEAAPAPAAPEPAAEPAAATAAPALRFRRGSKAGMSPAAVPMVGVISLDDDGAKPAAEKKPRRGRGKKAAAAPAAEAGAEASEPAKKPRRRAPKAKPKAE